MPLDLLGPGLRCLFVRSDSYGDLVLSEPLLRAAVARLGAGNVALAMRAKYRDLQPLLPAGLRFFDANIDPFRSGPGENIGELERLRNEIGRFEPDVVVVAAIEETWLDLYVAATADRAHRIKHGGIRTPIAVLQPLAEMLGERPPSRFDVQIAAEGQTELERAHRLAYALFGPAAAPGAPACRVPEDAGRTTDAWLREQGLDARPFAIVFPAGVANIVIKRWPAERFARVARVLETEHGLAVVAAGHVSETAIVAEFDAELRKLGGAPRRWLGEDGRIAELAALLQRARLYVGNDTGPMHIAAAVGTPVVGVFGGGHWPRFMAGGSRSIAVAHPLPCNGCDWDCLWSTPHCVELVDADAVEHAVQDALTGSGAARRELGPKLDAESLQLIADAAGKLRHERAAAEQRLASRIEWAIAERRRADSAEQAVAKSEAALAAERAWAAEEKGLRERLEARLRDCEADRSAAKQWAEEERALRERSEALQHGCEADRTDAMRRAEQERELRVQVQAQFESVRARLLMNRLRRLLGISQ